jgi:hypothetical protein
MQCGVCQRAEAAVLIINKLCSSRRYGLLLFRYSGYRARTHVRVCSHSSVYYTLHPRTMSGYLTELLEYHLTHLRLASCLATCLATHTKEQRNIRREVVTADAVVEA